MFNYKCDKCVEQDRLEYRWWPEFKKKAKSFWRHKVLRRPVPATNVKTYKLPRFWCDTCEKFIASIMPLANTELGLKTFVACHGEAKLVNSTLVYLMMNPCCSRVFLKGHKPTNWDELAKKLGMEGSNAAL